MPYISCLHYANVGLHAVARPGVRGYVVRIFGRGNPSPEIFSKKTSINAPIEKNKKALRVTGSRYREFLHIDSK